MANMHMHTPMHGVDTTLGLCGSFVLCYHSLQFHQLTALKAFTNRPLKDTTVFALGAVRVCTCM